MFDEEPGRDAHEQCRFEIDQLRARNEALEAKLAVMEENERKADEHFKESVEMYMEAIQKLEAKLAATESELETYRNSNKDFAKHIFETEVKFARIMETAKKINILLNQTIKFDLQIEAVDKATAKEVKVDAVPRS